MKQKLLKTMLLLCALVVGTSSVWADDVINNSATSSKLGNTGTSTWASEFDLTGSESGATYHIKSMGTKGTSNALQWNSNGFLYMKTTYSGHKLKSVSVTTTANKNIGVYASNAAYNAAPTGTALATLAATSSGATYTFTSDYTYLALKGTASSTSITNITIVWEATGGSSKPAGLSYTTTSYTIYLSDGFTAPTLNNPNSLAVSYAGNNNDVATVNSSTGAVTINGTGTVTVTATAAAQNVGGTDYAAGTASYTLRVNPDKVPISLSAGATLTLNDFSNAGSYNASEEDFKVTGSNSTDYYLTKLQCMLRSQETKNLQMRASSGYVILPKIQTSYGFDITVSSAQAVTIYKGDSKVATAADGSATYSSTETDVTLTIKAAGSASYVTGITITAKKAPTTLIFAANAQTVSKDGSATYTATCNHDGATITYESSDDDIAMVDNTGEVLGIAEGTVTITATVAETATYEGATATYSLTVVDDSKTATEITFAEDNYSLQEEHIQQIVPTVTTGYDGTISYESSDETVATVAADGTVTAIAPGETTITATGTATASYNGASDSYTLTVTRLQDVFALDGTLGLSNGADYTGANGTYATISKTGAPKYYTSGDAVRFYNNNTLIIASDTKAIAKVIITKGGTWTEPTCLNSNYSGTLSGTVWTCATAANRVDKLTIKFSGTSYITGITVIYNDLTTEEFSRDGLTIGNFGTICLPYQLRSERVTGAKFYKVASKTLESEAVKFITLEEVTTDLEAGYAYIFQAEATEISATYVPGTTVASPIVAATSRTGLTGVFERTAMPVGSYMLKDGQIYYVDQENYAYAGANKAYIDLANVSVAVDPEVKGVTLFVDGYETTVNAAKATTENGILFNLSGQRIQKPQKGVFIQNGKKFIVR